MNQSKVMRDHPFNIKSIRDNRCIMTIETQIKVSQKKGKKSGPHKYTVNLYHTGSSMVVNGRRVAMFTHAHKAAESQITNIQIIDSIDDQLHEVLLRALDKIQMQDTNNQQLDQSRQYISL